MIKKTKVIKAPRAIVKESFKCTAEHMESDGNMVFDSVTVISINAGMPFDKRGLPPHLRLYGCIYQVGYKEIYEERNKQVKIKEFFYDI